ncbi:hypothetical protein ACJ73_09873 [Blastomyces percursus]|uniref:Uncharacterized protein n=1 Tax=Blastomyces percursus TaxID=1658174 RepID=A0A1J9PQW6_9EURO|nr:hypothetical protein ACJ73_09873 [Blastomyces percursus]
MWWNVVQAQTDEIFIEAWDKLKAEYKDDYPEVVRYIEKEWLTESTKHHLLNLYTKEYFHLDNQASSRAEGAHAVIKRDLEISINDLLTVVQTLERTVNGQHQERKHELAAVRVARPIQLNSTLFNSIVNKVSPYALKLVLKIRDQYLPATDTSKPAIPLPCTQTTSNKLGIPCIHTIQRYFECGRPLRMRHFHKQSHLVDEDENDAAAEVDPRLLILNPHVVESKGRPTGSTNRVRSSQAQQQHEGSSHRDLSAFERQDQLDSQALTEHHSQQSPLPQDTTQTSWFLGPALDSAQETNIPSAQVPSLPQATSTLFNSPPAASQQPQPEPQSRQPAQITRRRQRRDENASLAPAKPRAPGRPRREDDGTVAKVPREMTGILRF